MHRITLKDIANKTGSSVSTVSAALNGSGRISRRASDHIRRTAEQMGFRPNLAAKLLKNPDVEIFGLAISDNPPQLAGHGVYSELLERFLAECHAENIRSQFEVNRAENAVPTMMLDGLAKGVIHAGVVNPRLANWLSNNPRYPFIAFEELWAHCVRSDFATGAYRAVQYLAATGHRRLVLCCGPEEYDINRQLAAGFLRGCEEFRLKPAAPIAYRDKGLTGAEQQRESAHWLRRFFEGPEKPQAILAAGQNFCAVALYELPRMGHRVPEDVSLVACCPAWEAVRSYPALCAIERNAPLLVASAIKMLKQLLRQLPPETPQQLVPADFTLRDTVRPRFG